MQLWCPCIRKPLKWGGPLWLTQVHCTYSGIYKWPTCPDYRTWSSFQEYLILFLFFWVNVHVHVYTSMQLDLNTESTSWQRTCTHDLISSSMTRSYSTRKQHEWNKSPKVRTLPLVSGYFLGRPSYNYTYTCTRCQGVPTIEFHGTQMQPSELDQTLIQKSKTTIVITSLYVHDTNMPRTSTQPYTMHINMQAHDQLSPKMTELCYENRHGTDTHYRPQQHVHNHTVHIHVHINMWACLKIAEPDDEVMATTLRSRNHFNDII